MAFTFGEDLTDDLDFVRFKTGDTTEAEAFMSDELITSMLTLYETKEAAAVAGARYILNKMAQPKFRADWLEVDPTSAIAMRKKLLEDLIAEVDPASEAISIDSVSTYRADSAMTSEPTWQPDGRP